LSLSDLFSRKRKDDPDGADSGASDAPVFPTRVLAKFLASLATRPQPQLLDIGPAIGINLTFFGEELGCKILVGELFKDIDRYVKEGKPEELPAFFDKRFVDEADGSRDGILCWDIFDYLEPKAGQALAREMVRILRPNGVLLAQFSTVESKTMYAIWSGCAATRRPQIAWRFGQMSSPSS